MVAQIEHKLRTGCPVACSLDIFGDHWSLLIIRNLMFFGIHEYKDMLKKEEQISSRMLSARLQHLETSGLIGSIPHPENKRRKYYYLMPMGKDLIHMMTHMIIWAIEHLNEHLDIPEEEMKLLKSDPEGFKENTVKRLLAWENQNLPEAAKTAVR